MTSAGHYAGRPAAGHRIVESVHQHGLQRVLRLTDNAEYELDLTEEPGRTAGEGLLEDVADAFTSWSVQKNGLAVESLENGVVGARSFLRWIDEHNRHAGSESRIERVRDITPSHITGYVVSQRSYSPYTLFGYLRQGVRVMVELGPGGREDTLWKVTEKRREAENEIPPPAPLEPVEEDDIKALRRAAVVFIAYLHRQTQWVRDLLYAKHPEQLSDEEQVKRQVLQGIIRSPDMKPDTSFLMRGQEARRRGKRPEWMLFKEYGTWAEALLGSSLRPWLFHDGHLIDAMGIWLCLLRAFNRSTVHTMNVPIRHDDGRMLLNPLKMRRPDRDRQWEEFVKDAPELEVQDARQRVTLQQIIDLTQPGRDHLEAIGKPTDRLLIRKGRGRQLKGVELKLGLPKTSPRTHTRKWAVRSDGTPLTPTSYGPLRQFMPGGPRDTPTHHDRRTNRVSYRPRNPEQLGEDQLQRSTDLAEEHDRLDSYLDTLHMQTVESAPEGSIPTIIAFCISPDSHPDTGHPCTNGIRGFLLCLLCPSGRSTLDKLPTQLAVLDQLEQWSQELNRDEWDEQWAWALQLITEIVQRRSRLELKEAQARITDVLRAFVETSMRGHIPTAPLEAQ